MYNDEYIIIIIIIYKEYIIIYCSTDKILQTLINIF